jgi:hypothetical protein
VCTDVSLEAGASVFDVGYSNYRRYSDEVVKLHRETVAVVQGDQKVSVHLMITIQKVTSNVQSVLPLLGSIRLLGSRPPGQGRH